MNKGIIIGIIIIAIIILAVSSLSLESTPSTEITQEVEPKDIAEEEPVEEDTENKGRELTVELTESVGLTAP